MRILFCLVLSLFLWWNDSSAEMALGRMVMVGFRGTSLDENPLFAEQVRRGEVGGVILYDWDTETASWGRNIASAEQVRQLTEELQRISPHPLLIAIDQEGGNVVHLREEKGFPLTESQESLGQKNDLDWTRTTADRTAKMLRELGITVNCTPVVDLAIKGGSIQKQQRAFSADSDLVIAHAREVIDAHRERGVLTVLKHFPGLGSGRGDTHKGFVDTTEVWEKEELLPFLQLIQEGRADMVMVGHQWNCYLDAEKPASLSKAVIGDLLRRQWGFSGVVITDDLQMGAIAHHYTLRERVKEAIQAGADILLFANQQEYDERVASRVAEVIKGLLADGEISLEQITQSVQRIHRLRKGREAFEEGT